MDEAKRLNPNYIHLDESVPNNRWTLLQGGTRSGKTFSVLQWLISLCIKHPKARMEIDIVRSTFKALKSTAWKDFEDLLKDYNLYSDKLHHKSDHRYNLNGNYINYYGADDAEKVHGRKRDIIFLNECNQIDAETIDQISPRTSHKIIADYNPSIGDDHWLDPYIIKYPPKITTYRDNPFLTEAQVIDIESKKDQPYWWSVYGNGERAQREGVIFTNWEIGEFDESLPYYYGLDFGFVNDPDACDKVAIDDKRGIIYVDEQFHEHRQTINELAVKINSLEYGSIVADSAEQRIINDLSTRCNRSIVPVKKGAGSIMQGITLMLNYKVVITERSVNTIKEFRNYSWATKGKEKPIDDWNHHIDEIRYIVYTFANNQVTPFKRNEDLHTRHARGDSTGADAAPWASEKPRGKGAISF